MLLRRLEREDDTAYGLRSPFRDKAVEKATNRPHAVIEAALAHVVKNKMEAAYFRSDLFELRRRLMEAWERFTTSGSATVIPIRGRQRQLAERPRTKTAG